MKFLFPLFLGFSFLVGCSSSGSTNTEGPKGPYFDLSGYMQQEIEQLQATGTVLEKTITLNGTAESQTLSDINYEQELSLFRNADINKPAWVDKYKTATNEGDLGQLTTTYTSLDSNLITQQLSIVQIGDEVRSISISRKTGSVLSSGQQELLYLPGQGYRINSSQLARVGGNLTSTIEGRFQQ